MYFRLFGIYRFFLTKKSPSSKVDGKQQMETASNGQFRELIGKLLVKGSDEKVALIDKQKIQNAINLLSSNSENAFQGFVDLINNDFKLQTILTNAFTVGDIFRHRAEQGDCRLFLSDNTQAWLVKPNLKKVIPIRTDPRKLTKYCLPKNMNDSSIQQNAGNPGCMTEEEFFLVMYLLIFQPELGKQALGFALAKDKYYIFHVTLNGRKVAFFVDWHDDEWFFDALEFGTVLDWNEGRVFVSFAAA